MTMHALARNRGNRYHASEPSLWIRPKSSGMERQVLDEAGIVVKGGSVEDL